MSKQIGDKSIEQLLAELGPPKNAGDNGVLSTRELSEKTGQSRVVVMAHLHRLNKEGRLLVGTRIITTISGGRHPVPVYHIQDAPPPAAAATCSRENVPEIRVFPIVRTVPSGA